MGSNLNNNQLNIDYYVQKKLYTNIMVTIYQKPVVNMQRIKRKKSKYITKENKKKKKHERKTRKDQRKSSETTTKEEIKW